MHLKKFLRRLVGKADSVPANEQYDRHHLQPPIVLRKILSRLDKPRELVKASRRPIIHQKLPNELLIIVTHFLSRRELMAMMHVNLLFLLLGLRVQYTIVDFFESDYKTTVWKLLRLAIPHIANYVQELKIRHPYERTVTMVVNQMLGRVIPLANNLKTLTIDADGFSTATLERLWQTRSAELRHLSLTTSNFDLRLVSLDAITVSRLVELEFRDSCDPSRPLTNEMQEFLASFLARTRQSLKALKLTFGLHTDVSHFFSALDEFDVLERFELGSLCTLSNPLALGNFLVRASHTLREVDIIWDPMWLDVRMVDTQGLTETYRVHAFLSQLEVVNIRMGNAANVSCVVNFASSRKAMLQKLTMIGRELNPSEVQMLCDSFLSGPSEQASRLTYLDICLNALKPVTFVLLCAALPELQHLHLTFNYVYNNSGQLGFDAFLDDIEQQSFASWKIRCLHVQRSYKDIDTTLDAGFTKLIERLPRLFPYFDGSSCRLSLVQ